jgi:two-component system cell cycle sensor histidine kinase/response regulator CckA
MNLETATSVAPSGGCRDIWPMSKAATILLVEDETFVRNVTCEVLRAAGHRVLCSENSAEGDSLHDKHCDEIDLLITDVVLPGENGQTLATKLKRRKPNLKVLLISGYADQVRQLQENLLEYLAKPFSSLMLLERVRQLLNSMEPSSAQGENPDLEDQAPRTWSR